MLFEGLLNGFFKTEENLLRIPNNSVKVISSKDFNEPNFISVILTEEEFDMGCQIACRRCRDAYKQGKIDSYVNGKEYDAHIQGVLSEIAVAKYLGIIDEWKPTINTFRTVPDICFNKTPIEVKSIGNYNALMNKGFSIKKSTLKRNEEDIFIFVYCDIRQTNIEFKCEIIGYATTKDVLLEYNEYSWYYPIDKIKKINKNQF